jgi:hypothetical protein
LPHCELEVPPWHWEGIELSQQPAHGLVPFVSAHNAHWVWMHTSPPGQSVAALHPHIPPDADVRHALPPCPPLLVQSVHWFPQWFGALTHVPPEQQAPLQGFMVPQPVAVHTPDTQAWPMAQSPSLRH